MSKDPAFLFYSQDFYTGVATLTMEDRGKYITLLCLMHQQGRMSEETICFLVGSVSVNLKSKFKVDENGLWYNERLEIEAEKRAKYTESRRINGEKGGRPKDEEIKPKRNHKVNHMDSHMEDENENKDIKIQKVKFDLLIDGGWSADVETYNGIMTNYPKLFKMKRPLLFKEHERLVKKWGIVKIKSAYRDMEGWAELLKKRDWAAGCADSWLTRDVKQ